MGLLNKLLQSLSYVLVSINLLHAKPEMQELANETNKQILIHNEQYKNMTHRDQLAIWNKYDNHVNNVSKVIMDVCNTGHIDENVLAMFDVVVGLVLEGMQNLKDNFSEQEYEKIYYSTLGLKSILNSVTNKRFMEIVGGFDDEFIANFDSIAYGKEFEATENLYA